MLKKLEYFTKRSLDVLLGEKEEFPIKHRLFNLILLFAIFVFFISAAVNTIIRESKTIILTTLIGGIIFSFFYWLSRIKREFKVTSILAFLLVLFPLTPFMWFNDGGLLGGYPYFLLLYGIMIILVFSGWLRALFLIALSAMFAALVIIEIYYPNLIHHCPGENCLFFNHVFGLTMEALSLFIIILAFIRAYEHAHRREAELNRKLMTLNKKLEELSRTDPLTGLSNRRDVLEKLKYNLLLAKRYREPFSIIMADIDDFKKVNDNYGHNCGDKVLIQLAEILRMSFRAEDTVSRWGGEEFLILLPKTDGISALVAANRIRRIVENTEFKCDGEKIKLTLSLGVAEFTPITDNIEAFIESADKALFLAKRKGKNRAEFNNKQI